MTAAVVMSSSDRLNRLRYPSASLAPRHAHRPPLGPGSDTLAAARADLLAPAYPSMISRVLPVAGPLDRVTVVAVTVIGF